MLRNSTYDIQEQAKASSVNRSHTTGYYDLVAGGLGCWLLIREGHEGNFWGSGDVPDLDLVVVRDIKT